MQCNLQESYKMKVINHLESKFNKFSYYRSKFESYSTVPFIILDNFLPENVAFSLSDEIDSIQDHQCKKFTRNGSYMQECNDLRIMENAADVIAQFHSKPGVQWLSNITGIKNLIPDPYLIGAGYSRSFKGDSLKNHVDFNWNNTLKLYRAVTLIIYLTPNWKEEWKGNLEFTNFKNESIMESIFTKWNRAVLWKHHESCFHGYPTPINCPSNESRKTLRLFFYVSEQEPTIENPAHRSLYWFDNNLNQPVDNSGKY